jgi:enamine deaminase RidA (YjgF/YER057c/UK114 family)
MPYRAGMERINYSSPSVWEPLRGYSRAVRAGDHLFISGTTAVSATGEVVAPGNAYDQTVFVLERVRKILERCGFSMEEVVRTRLFVTALSTWDEYARAHRMAFKHIRPASSIVQVARLVDPRLMIEIEVDALKGAMGAQEVSLTDV